MRRQNAPSPTVTFSETAKYPNFVTNSEPVAPYPRNGASVTVKSWNGVYDMYELTTPDPSLRLSS